MKKIFLAIAVFLAFVVSSSLGNSVSAIEVTDFNSLKTAFANSGEVTVNNEILITDNLVVASGKTVTLSGSGTLKLSGTWLEKSAPFYIEEGGHLIIDGVTIDGNGSKVTIGSRKERWDQPNNQDHRGVLIYVLGKLTIESGTIQNVTSRHIEGNSGIIRVTGDNADFTMNGGTISNNKFIDGYSHGIVYIERNGNFTMNNGEISNNSFNDEDDYFHSGTVYLSNTFGNNTTFTMNGGAIKDNKYHGVFVGSANGGAADLCTFTMNGGEISNNDMLNNKRKAGDGIDDSDLDYFYRIGYLYSDNFGGGIYIMGGTTILNGGEISGNKAVHGGGIGVNATGPTILNINGGTIKDNEAWTGGGIFVTGSDPESTLTMDPDSVEITINKGNITGNSAVHQGGGIYTVRHYTIRLKNVLITENEAGYLGGGIWGCPTSNIYTYVTNGGAIFDNKTTNSDTTNAGNDIVSLSKVEDYTTVLSERLLGGGQALYYKDSGVSGAAKDLNQPTLHQYVLGVVDGTPRYNHDQKNRITGINGANGYAMESDFLENSMTLAKRKAEVFITDNYAARGGGIGTNGNIIIGSNPDEPDGGEFTLEVEKKWEGDFASAEYRAEIALVVDGLELDSVVLTKDNPVGKFTGLPPGTYSVKEINNSETEVEIIYDKDLVTLSKQNNVERITVTNKKTKESPTKNAPTTGVLTKNMMATNTASTTMNSSFMVTSILFFIACAGYFIARR